MESSDNTGYVEAATMMSVAAALRAGRMPLVMGTEKLRGGAASLIEIRGFCAGPGPGPPECRGLGGRHTTDPQGLLGPT